jgi:hypothetical protein
MAGKGGYQRPTSPAPVSGPGSLSQRTDGGPADKQAAKYISGLPYGQGNEMMATQMAAPMEATSSPSPVPASQIAQAGQQQQAQLAAEPMPIVPLGAPTQRPSEPVTHGADLGAGPDMSSLGLQAPLLTQHESASSVLQAMAQSSTASPALQFLAQRIGGTF